MVLEKNVSKKYLVTGVQYNAPVNKEVLETLEHYAALHDAKILALPIIYRKAEEQRLDSRLAHLPLIENDLLLNSNIQIKQFDVRPQSINQ